MKTVALKDLVESPQRYNEIAQVLEDGGLVCFPCGGTYRIAADLEREDGVTRLLQSKRRTQKAPSLVFVESAAALKSVAAQIPRLAGELARKYWPGPLTILFEPHAELPRKVVKQLAKANGKIGVRVPNDTVAREILRAFGRPLFVSSANRQKGSGAGSPAQVRKNFANRVDLFVDAGDLPAVPGSTVVDIAGEDAVVTRPGAIAPEELRAAG